MKKDTIGTKNGTAAVTEAPRPKLPEKKENEIPAFGKLLEGIVPKEHQEKFQAYASGRPRLMELLRKPELSEDDRKEIAAAYESFTQEEARKTAMVKAEAPSVASRVGVSEEEAQVLLERYTPKQLDELALVAQGKGLNPKNFIAIDAALFEDGSYGGRREESLAVAAVHAALSKMINEELVRHASRQAVHAQDENLDTLWERTGRKVRADEEEAAKANGGDTDTDEFEDRVGKKTAEEYAKAAERILHRAKNSGADRAPEYELPTDIVVELFKLFNNDREDLYDFLHFTNEKFSLGKDDDPEKVADMVFGKILSAFVVEKGEWIVLSERSLLYTEARRAQLVEMIDNGLIGKAALLEVGLPKEKPPVVAGEEKTEREEGEDEEEEGDDLASDEQLPDESDEEED